MPDSVGLEGLLERLNALHVTEIAYAEPLPAPMPSPSFVGRQGYRTASPDGVGADAVSGIPGALGESVKVIDIEYGWNINHEDLDSARLAGATILNGTPVGAFGDDHGTAVLGVLVGDADAQGITGLIPRAAVGMVNAQNSERGYDLVNAIDLARRNLVPGDVMLIEQQTVGPNGGCGSDQVGCAPVEYVAAFYDAIRLATAQGIIVVEAAGNGRQNLDGPEYADSMRLRPDSGAIVVGAGAAPGCGIARSRLDFSNYGTRVNLQGWGNCVTTTGYGWLYGGTDRNAFYTSSFGGTSSASPMVAAAAAALSSAHELSTGGNLRPHEVRARLMSTGTAQDYAVAGEIGPLPNLQAALAQPVQAQSVPSAPTGFTISKSDANRSAMISWTPPTSDGGSAITGYRVARTGYGTDQGWTAVLPATARSQEFLNLSNGGAYTLSVRAINASGTGTSAAGTVTIGVPSAPTEFKVAKSDANRSATITWAPPPSDGGYPITNYRVTRTGHATELPWTIVLAATSRSHEFTSLTTGGTYTLSVQAINTVGTGPSASGPVTMGVTAPGAPNGFTAVKSDAQRSATISWVPPTSDGGSPITGYRVARTGHGTEPSWSATVAATARSQEFLNLTPGGSYTLSVQAINAAGTGGSAAGTIFIGALPGAPTGFTATRSDANRSATIAWGPPVSDGGYPIRGYRVVRTGHGTEQPWMTVLPATARSHEFTNLAEAGTYTLSVEATTAAGTGPSASGTVTLRPVDTRTSRKLAAGETARVHVSDTGGATVFGNLTVTAPEGVGHTTAYPCLEGRPLASNNNFVANQTIPNFAMVRADAEGYICLYTTTAAHLLWDQVGQSTGVAATNAVRLLDTRMPAPPLRRISLTLNGEVRITGPGTSVLPVIVECPADLVIVLQANVTQAAPAGETRSPYEQIGGGLRNPVLHVPCTGKPEAQDLHLSKANATLVLGLYSGEGVATAHTVGRYSASSAAWTIPVDEVVTIEPTIVRVVG